MEQAVKRHDRGDKGEQDAPAGGGAEPKEPFSLLQELPGPLMRQLVQRHLDAKDCLALLRTSHALARAAVQHRTHQQRRALKWTWQSRKREGSTLDTPEVATAASLLVRWAPAELRVELLGYWAGPFPAFNVPAALLPLITSLRLTCMHLSPAAMANSLQQCRRLHTLDVDQCSFAEAPQPTRDLQPLPLLRTFGCWDGQGPQASQPWAVRDLGALCALATEVISRAHVEDWAPHFTRVTRWDAIRYLGSGALLALLRAPSLRHIQAFGLRLDQDHSQEACRWETLEVRTLDDARQLLRLPSGVGRVVVTESFTLPDVDPDQQEEMAAVLQQWGAAGRLQAAGSPPHEWQFPHWRLGEEEAQGGFFKLVMAHADAVADHALLLRRTVLPQGGGPLTLELSLEQGCPVAPTLQQLAPLLVGTCVRTLCLRLDEDIDDDEEDELPNVLSAVPATITCIHLRMLSVHRAWEVLSGPAATHALRVVAMLVLEPVDPEALGEQDLRELCAAHQPLVQLEVVRVD